MKLLREKAKEAQSWYMYFYLELNAFTTHSAVANLYHFYKTLSPAFVIVIVALLSRDNPQFNETTEVFVFWTDLNPNPGWMDNQNVTPCLNKEHLKKIEEIVDRKIKKMAFDWLVFQMLFIKELNLE